MEKDVPMTENRPLPFQSLNFTLIEDKRPRAALRMTASEDDMYELHVEKGPASNPSSQFTRQIPRDSAQNLKDALQDAGVFGWEESYGNEAGRAPMRWTLAIVFKEGVFSLSSKGGNAVPAGFDQMLDEFYRLDFPRPQKTVRSGSSAGSIGTAINALGARGLGGLSAGDLGAYGAAGGAAGADFSQLADMMKAGGLPGMDGEDLSRLLADAQSNPAALQQRMREEFLHLPADEQERMLDMLASTGVASRAWWERFLRG